MRGQIGAAPFEASVAAQPSYLRVTG